MPTNVVSIANSRKHLTPGEIEARKQAEQSMQRKQVRLRMPQYVRENELAASYWKRTVQMMKDITLLDDLDSDILAAYCHISARLELLTKMLNANIADGGLCEDIIKRIEASERNRLSYAEKLGLTPSGRVRLAKTRAEENTVDPNGDLYGD